MKKWKIALGVVVGLVVVVVAGVLFLGSNLDGIVADAIETYGTRLTGTKVSVGSVSVQLREGRLTIRDLRVANPEGFSNRDALALGRLVLDIDPASLRKEPYVVDELLSEAASMIYEVDAKGRRNLDVIRAHMEAAETGKAAGQGGQAAPPPRLIVRKLEQGGGSVTVDASALGLEGRTVELPAFTLTGLGAPDGAPADRIGRQVLTRLMEQAGKAAVDQELKGKLNDLLGGQNLEDSVKDKVKGLLGG